MLEGCAAPHPGAGLDFRIDSVRVGQVIVLDARRRYRYLSLICSATPEALCVYLFALGALRDDSMMRMRCADKLSVGFSCKRLDIREVAVGAPVA